MPTMCMGFGPYLATNKHESAQIKRYTIHDSSCVLHLASCILYPIFSTQDCLVACSIGVPFTAVLWCQPCGELALIAKGSLPKRIAGAKVAGVVEEKVVCE